MTRAPVEFAFSDESLSQLDPADIARPQQQALIALLATSARDSSSESFSESGRSKVISTSAVSADAVLEPGERSR